MKLRKALALVLSLLMVFSVFVPAVSAAEKEEYPIIYIPGTRNPLYADKNNPSQDNRIWKIGVDVGAVVKEALAPCLKELALGVVRDDYTAYCDELANTVVPLFEKIVLDKNGEASNGSGVEKESASRYYAAKSGNYGFWDYHFVYDWRLSPMDVCHQLKAHIDRVKTLTGKDKVVLIGRCMGANMISAYFTEYYDHAVESVDTIVMYEPSNLGLDILGAIWSGQVSLDDEQLDLFLDYYLSHEDLIEDPATAELISALVGVLQEIKMLGIGTGLVNKLLENVGDNLIPRLLLGTFGSFPSFWSMVGKEYYEDARKFVFSGREEEYEGFIAKTDDWYYNVMEKLPETMKKLENDGVSIGVLVKYNIPSYPFYENASQQTDMVSDVYHVSYYATSAPYGETLSEEYINGLKDTKYLSPDKMIDASTCLFPDKTWFIKDISHDPFPPSIDKLIRAFINSHGEMTVFSDENYPQYLQYNAENDTITPVKEEEPAKNNPFTDFINKFVRFFKALFNSLKNLFAK
ncbi:MAG: hypothetical protein J6A97_06890 [Clostridia bacterium]|nr:hypothetical protein [Clostridia bacterium]